MKAIVEVCFICNKDKIPPGVIVWGAKHLIIDMEPCDGCKKHLGSGNVAVVSVSKKENGEVAEFHQSVIVTRPLAKKIFDSSIPKDNIICVTPGEWKMISVYLKLGSEE